MAGMTPAQKQFYNEHGYVKIKGALDPETVARTCSWVTDLESWQPSKDKWMHHYEQNGSGQAQLARTENFVPYHEGLAEVIVRGLVPQLAADALGEESVLFKEKVNYKAPGGAGYAAHQDAPAYAQENCHATCLVALDKATLANGCLEFSSFPATNTDLIGLTKDGIIDDAVASKLDWKPVETEPGDVVVFSSYVPHRSRPNTSSEWRRLLYLTYNRASAGDLRSEYYSDKRANMAAGRLSMIGHFQGKLAEPPSGTLAVLQKIESLFAERGSTHYDSFTTQDEHARVTAFVAQQAGADRATVVAAFLHDIGHLLLDEHAGRSDFLQEDRCHEHAGHVFLRSRFGAAVSEPVRLHVGAKRYLCSVDAAYYDGLSEASKRSLALQGGPLSANEAAEWEKQPYASVAAQMRRWEDEGKRLWESGKLTEAMLPSRDALLGETARFLEEASP